MKPLTILCLSFAFTATATAQSVTTGQQLIKKKCGTEQVFLPPGKYGRDFPPLFKQIAVLDARPDTTRIGIVRTGRVAQHEVLLKTRASEHLTGYFNSVYSKPSAPNSLLIVLRDLWIATPDSFDIKLLHKEWTVRFRVEAYLEAKDGYLPLTRMDSTATGLRGEDASTVGETQFRELFDVFMDQVAACDLNRERRSVSRQQIDSFNRMRFAYPMDTATRLVKGVYASVDEFRENAPSISNYTIDNDPSGKPELNIPDETGATYYNHTAWGYCDGSQVYVMMDGNLYPVFNVGHQFYVIGSKEYRQRTRRVGYSIGTFVPIGGLIGTYAVASATAGVDIANGTIRTLRIFRVDTDTGKITE